MPPRGTPTARQQRLGFELRKLRERAGMSATEAAALMSLTQSRVSNIELGRYGVSADRVRMFARTYKCGDPALIDALAAMTTGRTRNWWEEYRDTLPAMLLDLAELEHHAASIRTAQFTHLPGLLQTVDYARLIFRQNIPELSPPEVEHLVSHRIKRQGILYKDEPTPNIAVIHEAALRMQFGGPDVMREQLQHIVKMGERDNVTVLVIPFSAGIFPGTGQTVVYAEGPVPQLDTVQLDTEHGSEFLYADAQLERYRTFMDRFEAAALDADASSELIHSIINSL
ncbi:helix-turn-helix domain-containing protein [Streptomyces gobiensis]|uniref:helix-turn-helix domain-containing protein n=1 Tax=Streptomyces gobiensis TaxID=2875706 RepID=UPI002410FC3E|nr:helix-turn-helix transcriptional regulator [Streptomyces gobiensis]UGY93378.1 helix-turn-helix domain-containing protein [Streptomyces gobiensis]